MKQEIGRDSSRNTISTRLTGIPFSELPGQSLLFTSYLSNPCSLKRYYPNAVESPLDVARSIPMVLEKYTTDRKDLCNALSELNIALGSSSETSANIDLLRRDDVVAVVTGQQAGLFGGPIYTLYKALSAIQLAQDLTARGYKAVPVFWAATEDHDLDEVSTTYFLSPSSGILRARYDSSTAKENLPVGAVELDEEVSRVIDKIFADLRPSGFSSEARALLNGIWRAGNNYGRAFCETISRLTSRYGLIMIDPLIPDLKRLASPLYKKAVERSDEIVAAIAERDAALEQDGFHSQVQVDGSYFPLFWHDSEGGRNALRKIEPGIYRAKGRPVRFSTEELVAIAQNAPDRLSPGVMLRPVVQDHLLPTIAYFGGGAEISYFAQNSVVYQALERPITPIFHRQSFTVLEPKAVKSLTKLGLEPSDLFKPTESTVLEWARANIDPEMEGLFSSAETTLNRELDRIETRLAAIDKTLINNAEKRRRKMIYHINAIRKKALLALSRKNGDAERRIAELSSVVMPNGHLQERSINVFSFINEFGPGFVELLYEAVDLNDKRHRIIEMLNE